MTGFDGRGSAETSAPVVKNYEGIGELVVGGSSDPTRALFIALCMLDDPRINQYFLDVKLKMWDRMTKTRIFPREGMSLPNGEVFVAPDEKNQENE